VINVVDLSGCEICNTVKKEEYCFSIQKIHSQVTVLFSAVEWNIIHLYSVLLDVAVQVIFPPFFSYKFCEFHFNVNLSYVNFG